MKKAASMDSEEARRILFRRVQNLDSENGLKIMGYFLLQGWGEQEMLQLAMASDYDLQSLVAKSKFELGLTAPRKLSSDFSKPRVSSLDLSGFNSYSAEMSKLNEESSKIYSPYSLYQSNQNYCLPSQALDQWHFNSTSSEAPLLSPTQLGLQTNTYSQEINTTIPFNNASKHLLPTTLSPWEYSCMSSSISSSPKPCLYFSRGYCKHGNNCRFSHTITTRDALSSSPVLVDRSSTVGYNGGEEVPAVSLDSLRVELKELLRGRKSPVSIASLPQLYFEKFGKTLQADGYLTESQRHGKAGFSLTKLLLKLKNTVMLIDRPHGQHAVMLVEDDSGNDDSINITGGPSSRQIYLTFPPESTFSEEDVIIHFRAYGPVEDVRIPYQQKRMFGFVTFTFSETVRNILKEGSPHYICGARVLVKPYKEKGKLNINDRKITERANNWTQLNGLINGENLPLISTGLRYKIEDENISSLEKKIQDLNLDHNNSNSNNTKNNDINDINNNKNTEADDKDSVAAEDCFDLQPNMFSYVMDVLEGDGKENESAELNDYPTYSTSEFTKLPLLHDPYRNISNPATKTNNNLMASLAGPYNWSDPTLFAWSVY